MKLKGILWELSGYSDFYVYLCAAIGNLKEHDEKGF